MASYIWINSIFQTTVQKEKQDWEREKAKELQMMEAERAQLEEMRAILAKQEVLLSHYHYLG